MPDIRERSENHRANPSNFHMEGSHMRLTFLGKETQGGGSPTLFLTDRETYVVQGWKVAGQRPTVIEIPAALLRHLQPGTALDTPLSATGRQWEDDSGTSWDTYTLTGNAVTDPDALSQMDIPGHESCVEVGRMRKDTDGAAVAGASV
jgi:hypothetical protein